MAEETKKGYLTQKFTFENPVEKASSRSLFDVTIILSLHSLLSSYDVFYQSTRSHALLLVHSLNSHPPQTILLLAFSTPLLANPLSPVRPLLPFVHPPLTPPSANVLMNAARPATTRATLTPPSSKAATTSNPPRPWAAASIHMPTATTKGSDSRVRDHTTSSPS